MDIEFEASVGESLELVIQGVCVNVDGTTGELKISPAGLGTEQTVLKNPSNCHFRIFSDRGILCLYEANHHVIMPLQVAQSPMDHILIRGDESRIEKLQVRKMKSIWQNKQ